MTIIIRPKASDLIFAMTPQERKNATFKANAKLNELMASGEYDLDITNIYVEINKGYGDEEVSVILYTYQSGSEENLGYVAFFASEDEAYAWLANGRKSTRWFKKTLEALANDITDDLPFAVDEWLYDSDIVDEVDCIEEIELVLDAWDCGGYTELEVLAAKKKVNDKIMDTLLPHTGTWTGTDEHGKINIVNRLPDGSLTYTIDYVVSEEATTASMRKKASDHFKKSSAAFWGAFKAKQDALALPQK